MPRVCYTFQNRYRSMSSFFEKRKRCFLYHYPVDMMSHDPIDDSWINLNTIKGCRYWGWVSLSDRTRGELWTYKSNKNRMLLQLQIPSAQLVFHEEYLKLKKELKYFKKKLRSKRIRFIPDDESFLF